MLSFFASLQYRYNGNTAMIHYVTCTYLTQTLVTCFEPYFYSVLLKLV